MDSPSNNPYDPLLRVQRWKVLDNIHPGRDSTNVWVCTGDAKNHEIEDSHRTIQIDLHLLYAHLWHQSSAVHDLQSRNPTT